MSSAQYISVRESAQLLGVTEKKIMDLIDERKLQAYRIADKFLRLKKSDVQNLRNAGTVAQQHRQIEYSTQERLQDFFYFNDFYMLSLVAVLVLLYIIFYT